MSRYFSVLLIRMGANTCSQATNLVDCWSSKLRLICFKKNPMMVKYLASRSTEQKHYRLVKPCLSLSTCLPPPSPPQEKWPSRWKSRNWKILKHLTLNLVSVSQSLLCRSSFFSPHRNTNMQVVQQGEPFAPVRLVPCCWFDVCVAGVYTAYKPYLNKDEEIIKQLQKVSSVSSSCCCCCYWSTNWSHVAFKDTVLKKLKSSTQ